jgi:hypothetical protein
MENNDILWRTSKSLEIIINFFKNFLLLMKETSQCHKDGVKVFCQIKHGKHIKGYSCCPLPPNPFYLNLHVYIGTKLDNRFGV